MKQDYKSAAPPVSPVILGFNHET